MSDVFILISPFILLPASIYLAVKGFRLASRYFSAPVLADMPFQQMHTEFEVPADGEYAIWQVGYGVNRAPVFMPPVSIYQATPGEALPLWRARSYVYVKPLGKPRVLVLTFDAKAGRHHLAFTEDFPTEPKPKLLGIFARRQFDLSGYSLQVREKRPGWMGVVGILLLFLALASFIAAFALTAQPASPAQ